MLYLEKLTVCGAVQDGARRSSPEAMALLGWDLPTCVVGKLGSGFARCTGAVKSCRPFFEGEVAGVRDVLALDLD